MSLYSEYLLYGVGGHLEGDGLILSDLFTLLQHSLDHF